MSCCICNGPLGRYGNSPHPLGAGDERCCDGCNMSVVLRARLFSEECGGSLDGGPSKMFVSSGKWDAPSCTGSLLFYEPAVGFRAVVSVTPRGAGQIRLFGELQLREQQSALGDISCPHPDTVVKIKRVGTCVTVRAESLRFWAEAVV